MSCLTKRNERWVIDGYDHTGKRRRIKLPKGTTRGEGLKALREFEDQNDKKIYRPAKKIPLFKGVAADWLESHKGNVRDSTWDMYEQMIRIHLVGFHDHKINSIDTASVEKLFTVKHNAGMPHSTLGKVRTALNKTMKYAVRHKLTDHNPVTDAEMPRKIENPEEEEKKRFLTTHEINSLLDAVSTQKYNTLFRLAVFSGARQGELLGLRWTDVDWINSQIHIRRSFNKDAMRPPKNKTSRRRIDIGPTTMEVLKSWMHACPKTDGNLVFPNNAGKPMNNNNMLRRHYYPGLKKAGIERIRFHDLRHTYASLLISTDVNIKYLQTQMGHSTITTTMDTYGHLMEEVNREPARELEKAVFKKPVTIWSLKQKGATESRSR